MVDRGLCNASFIFNFLENSKIGFFRLNFFNAVQSRFEFLSKNRPVSKVDFLDLGCLRLRQCWWRTKLNFLLVTRLRCLILTIVKLPTWTAGSFQKPDLFGLSYAVRISGPRFINLVRGPRTVVRIFIGNWFWSGKSYSYWSEPKSHGPSDELCHTNFGPRSNRYLVRIFVHGYVLGPVLCPMFSFNFKLIGQ